MKNKIIHYNPELKPLARKLRSYSTLSEVLLWKKIKGRTFGYEFHRQVPIDDYIVDFYCHELLLAIEIDGNTHDYNFDKDQERQLRLEGLGIKFLRVSDQNVKRNMTDVLRALEARISEIEKGERLEEIS